MENSNVEENVKLLMKELSVLMRTSPQRGEDGNHRWSKIVESSEREVHNICNKFYELRKGPNPKKKMAELNNDVKQVTKYVKCLQECVNVQLFERKQESEKPKMYSCRELERFTADFSRPIGSGGFSRVYQGQFPAGPEIAVKVLQENDVVLDMFLAELSTMGRTSHRYLVKLYGYCFDKKMKALVYEYMEKGSLGDILYGNPLGLDWKKYYEIAIKIAEGLSFLHHDCPKTIIHHDIKPANVLLDSEFSPKITDFGLAKFMNQCLTHLTNTGLKGTTCFVAPEVMYPGFEVNEKCDVYSFGMVLFEILSMQKLDQSKGWFPVEVYKKFKAGEHDSVFEACSISHENREDAKILSVVALWCVQFNRTARPSMSKVVKMLKKQITLHSPPDPFPQFEESPLPTIPEEVDPEFSPSRYNESSGNIHGREIAVANRPKKYMGRLLESINTVESSTIGIPSVDGYLHSLSDELNALMLIRPSGGVEEDGWFEGHEIEINNLLDEFYVLKDSQDPKNRSAYTWNLIQKVNELRRYVSVLQECVSVETLQKELGVAQLERYSCEDLESFTAWFSNQLGSSVYRKLYKGQIPEGLNIAVEILKEDKDVEERFMALLRRGGSTYHPYLIKLYGYCFHKKMKALVYEYVEGGSFDKILYDNPHGIEWKKFYAIAINIAEGLSFLHNACPGSVIHYEVRAANVLIDSNLSPKIIGFRLAKDGVRHRANRAMSGHFMAPEMLFPWSRATPKCDVYSFGMLLFDILGMEKTLRNHEWFPRQVWVKFEAEELDDILANCGISEDNRDDAETLAMVALWCVQYTHEMRPSMSDVVKMLKKEMHVQRPKNPFVQSAEHASPAILEESFRYSSTRKPKRYSSKDLAKFTSQFSSKIGPSAFSKVYKGQFRDGVKVAVKVLEENYFEEETFITEVNTMGRIYHPDLVKLYGYCFEKNMKALVFEYMDKGSFDAILYDNPDGLQWEKLYAIAIAIAKGISYLHSTRLERIFHNDVMAANVLIDSNLSVKITEYGLAKLKKKEASHGTKTGMRGSTSYIAPELLHPFAPVSFECDVYSFGMLLFEILGMKGDSHKEGFFPKRVWEKFGSGRLHQLLRECGISPKNIAKAETLSVVALWCVQHSPTARPSMSTVLYTLERQICAWIPQNPFTAPAPLPTQEQLQSQASPSRFSESLREWKFQEKSTSG